MPWFVYLLLYLVIGLLVARKVYWSDTFQEELNGYDDGLFVFFTISTIFVWPIVAIVYPCYRLIAMPPRQVRLEKKKKELENVIYKLEREVLR